MGWNYIRARTRPGHCEHSSQFFCFSSSFSPQNKTETHYHHLTNTAIVLPSVCDTCHCQCDTNKKRKFLVLIIALWGLRSEVSGSFILTCCNYHYSEPSQQIVKFLDLNRENCSIKINQSWVIKRNTRPPTCPPILFIRKPTLKSTNKIRDIIIRFICIIKSQKYKKIEIWK